MRIKFKLPHGYKARTVGLVLARVGSGWQFAGADRGGLLVVARNSRGHALFEGVRFATRREGMTAASMAGLKGYAIQDCKGGSYSIIRQEYEATPRASLKRPDGSEYGEDFDIIGGGYGEG